MAAAATKLLQQKCWTLGYAEEEMRADSCEACSGSDATELVDDPSSGVAPYRLCTSCAKRLRHFALRPREWFNLAKTRGPSPYFLHDDFYLDDGTAMQPEIELEDPEGYPYPPVSEWQRDLTLALQVAHSKWSLPESAVEAISEFPPDAVLAELTRAIHEHRSAHIECRGYEIVARAVGTFAADWLREHWDGASYEALPCLIEAAATCLPREEAASRVITAIRALPRPLANDSLRHAAWLRNEAILDLIEELVLPPITEDWGRLAACSEFSWSRTQAWLDRGRPMSLIALDALKAILSWDTRLLETLKPVLREAPTETILAERLQAYCSADPVPRVERATKYVLERATQLRHGVRAT